MTKAMTPADRHDALFIEAMNLLMGQAHAPGDGADHAARRGLSDPQLRARIREWCKRSPGHLAAWHELQAIDGIAGAVLAVDRPKSAFSRRGVMLGALALAGTGAAGGLMLPNPLRWLRSDYATAQGEQLPLQLPDGSRITLGPRSNLALDFSGGQRRLRLIEGMMMLSLRPPLSPTEAPMRVEVAGMILTAQEAEADISADSGALSVAVLSGAVRLEGPALPEAVTAAAGQRIGLDPRHGGRLTDLPADQMGLWRKGHIIADDETVAAMVAKVARWQRGRVMVTDDALARQRVSGIYQLSDPTEALRAIVAPHGGAVRRIPPFLTLVSAG